MIRRPLTDFSIWVTRHLPPTVIRDAERIALSLAFIFVGVTSGISVVGPQEPSRVERIVPVWVYLEWSVTLTVGGIATIIGMWLSHRNTERFGIALAAVGCATYGVALTSAGFGTRSFVFGILFLLIALVKVLRLCISTAASATREEQ